LDVLVEEGYGYDSSLFPVRRPGGGYGYPGASPDPCWLACGGGRLAELPPATLSVGPWRLPAGGGAYFRLFPYSLIRSALTACEHRGVPGTFYIHPWEIDPGQPRMSVPWWTKLRHYGGLARTEGRLSRLLREFRFGTMAETVAGSGGRLLAHATLHLAEPKGAARELERCVKTLRMTGCMLPTDLPAGALHEDRYDALWEAAQSLDVPVVLHPLMDGPAACMFQATPRFKNLYGRTIDTPIVATQLILAGVFDRYPKLMK
jgi:hypothetical protein